MIKLTLLELVSDMLVVIDSENVSSVADTEEAGMCVNIANRAFEEMATAKRWRHFRTYSSLTTTTTLNEMQWPAGTYEMAQGHLYYAGNRVYYLSPEDFLSMTIKRNTAESNIAAYNSIKIFTDRNPIYFTSDDDLTLRFDAIPNTISGLQGSDTMGIIWKHPTSRLSADADQFDMPAVAFSALSLLCQAKALSELKDDDQKAQAYTRMYKQELSRLSTRSRLVDPDPDVRDSIVPRKSMSQIQPPLFGTN